MIAHLILTVLALGACCVSTVIAMYVLRRPAQVIHVSSPRVVSQPPVARAAQHVHHHRHEGARVHVDARQVHLTGPPVLESRAREIER